MKSGPLSDWQKVICRSYGGGDYAHLADEANPWPDIYNAGDGLFVFLLVETDKAEDCNDVTIAAQRLDTALDDIQTVFGALCRQYPELVS